MTQRSLGIALVGLLILATFAASYYFSQPPRRPQRPTVPVDDGSNQTAANGASEKLGRPLTPAAPRKLPLLARVPEFPWSHSEQESISTDHFAGKAWLVNFVSAKHISSDSPSVARYVELLDAMRTVALANRVRLVTVVAEGEVPADSPERDELRRAGLDGKRWQLLDGPLEQRRAWIDATLRLARGPSGAGPTGAESTTNNSSAPAGDSSEPAPAPDSPIPSAESTMVLIDPQGDIRALYDVRVAESAARALGDLVTVTQERVLLVEALVDPPWLEERRQQQVDAAKGYAPVHDFRFTDRVRESGITFRHRIVDDAGRALITAHYDHGNGIAIADVDGDERLDVYFVNQVGASQLWRNVGNGRFEEITERAGVALRGRIGVSASFADIDNDGDPDLYVTTVRHGNALFENDGKGVFRDISREAGVDYSGHSSSAEFFDYDRDGLLDLLVVNVGKYTTEKRARVKSDRYTGPDQRDYEYWVSNPDAFAAHLKEGRAEASRMYRNLGGNRFEDVTEQVGLGDLHWTGDASPLDANEDGWPDLYFVNMQGHDVYYENQGGKRFVDKSRELFPATPWGSMGIKVFDFNNDGRPDIFITDMHTDMAKDLDPRHEKDKIPADAMDPKMLATDGKHVWGNAFFVNEGNGKYVERSDSLGVENFWPWGVSTGDLNADGYLDAFVTACMNFPYRYAINSVMLNDRGTRFLDSEFVLGVEPRRARRTAVPWFELDVAGVDRGHPITKALSKEGAQVQRAVVWGSIGSRSSVVFDIDGDGDLDIITSDFNTEPQILISDLAQRHPDLHYLVVQLVGRRSNRDALGATVRVRTGDRTLTQVHDGQSGYLSQSSMPLYFGLGEHDAAVAVEVTWPSGAKTTIAGPVPSGKRLKIEEPEAAP